MSSENIKLNMEMELEREKLTENYIKQSIAMEIQSKRIEHQSNAIKYQSNVIELQIRGIELLLNKIHVITIKSEETFFNKRGLYIME